MDLFLTHNPYTIETTFLIDDERCNAVWFHNLTMSGSVSRRLQMWIAPFFDKLHEEYPAKEKFYLTFKGTSTDCDDMVEEAHRAELRLGISVDIKTQPCGDPENKFSRLQELYREAQEGPYEDFKTIEMAEGFQKISDRKLSVSIMAPMKNGKSTLLNAIMGREILPNATQRCTAKISYIEHSPGINGFEAKKVDKAQKPTEYISCTPELLQQWNSDNSVCHVLIRGELPGIHIKDYHLQFVDTPGPDSAVHLEDRTTIERFLNDNSLPMICYIIDRVNDAEKKYLERLQKHMQQYGKQSEDRFIFIVPRMDQIKVSKADTRENNPIRTKVEEIRNDLQKLGISNPRIFPVSAWLALKAREYNTLNEDDQEEFRDCFKIFRRTMKRIDSTLMDFTSISPVIRMKLTAKLNEIRKKYNEDNDTVKDNLRYAELLSGIPALEMAIEEYLLKYSVPARIYDAAAMFEDGIKKANAERSLYAEIETKQTSLTEIERNIKELRNFLEKGKGAQALRERFPEQWSESSTLKKELSTAEREFDIRIRERLAEWIPRTQDSSGYITPEESEEYIFSFVSFMKGLTGEMLGVYANAVEDDAKRQFNELKEAYEEKIKVILGEMPPELQNFVNKFDFVFKRTFRINLKTQEMIVRRVEAYIETRQREITREKDGMWKAFWSILPGTSKTTTENVTKYRKIERVPVSAIRTGIKTESSVILQQGLEQAQNLAELHYKKLREKMFEQFAKVDAALVEFNQDLQRKLYSRESEGKELENYKNILEWVKRFENKLAHVLDQEN